MDELQRAYLGHCADIGPPRPVILPWPLQRLANAKVMAFDVQIDIHQLLL
jgi:hypothetical protein